MKRLWCSLFGHITWHRSGMLEYNDFYGRTHEKMSTWTECRRCGVKL